MPALRLKLNNKNNNFLKRIYYITKNIVSLFVSYPENNPDQGILIDL